MAAEKDEDAESPTSNIGDTPLPSLSTWLSNWLGFQLPTIPMPQSARNLDKAVGKILLAAGENTAARIKVSTNKVRATGKLMLKVFTARMRRKGKLRIGRRSLLWRSMNLTKMQAAATRWMLTPKLMMIG